MTLGGIEVRQAHGGIRESGKGLRRNWREPSCPAERAVKRAARKTGATRGTVAAPLTAVRVLVVPSLFPVNIHGLPVFPAIPSSPSHPSMKIRRRILTGMGPLLALFFSSPLISGAGAQDLLLPDHAEWSYLHPLNGVNPAGNDLRF